MGHWPSVLKGRAVHGLSLSSSVGEGAAAPQGSQGALASSESMSGGREIRAASTCGPGSEVHRPVRPRDTEAFREGDPLLLCTQVLTRVPPPGRHPRTYSHTCVCSRNPVPLSLTIK